MVLRDHGKPSRRCMWVLQFFTCVHGDPLAFEDVSGQYQDYFSIRYADVLLMAAELGSGNAQNYFDQVRQRAY